MSQNNLNRLRDLVSQAEEIYNGRTNDFQKAIGAREQVMAEWAEGMLKVKEKLPFELPEDLSHKALFPSLYKSPPDKDGYEKEERAFQALLKRIGEVRENGIRTAVEELETYVAEN